MLDFLKVMNWPKYRAFLCQHVHGWHKVSHASGNTYRSYKCNKCYRSYWFWQ